MNKKKREVAVGDEFNVTREIDKYRPIYYAGVSGDFNPIHIDAEFAKNVNLKGNILHGMCTMSFIATAIVEWNGCGPECLKKLKVRFTKPVYPNDSIEIKGRVKEIVNKEVLCDIIVKNQKGEIVCIGSCIVELK